MMSWSCHILGLLVEWGRLGHVINARVMPHVSQASRCFQIQERMPLYLMLVEWPFGARTMYYLHLYNKCGAIYPYSWQTSVGDHAGVCGNTIYNPVHAPTIICQTAPIGRLFGKVRTSLSRPVRSTANHDIPEEQTFPSHDYHYYPKPPFMSTYIHVCVTGYQLARYIGVDKNAVVPYCPPLLRQKRSPEMKNDRTQTSPRHANPAVSLHVLCW